MLGKGGAKYIDAGYLLTKREAGSDQTDQLYEINIQGKLKFKAGLKIQNAHQLNRIILIFRGSWMIIGFVISQKYYNLYQKPNRYISLKLFYLKSTMPIQMSLFDSCFNEIREDFFLEGDKIFPNVRITNRGECEGEYNTFTGFDQETKAFYIVISFE